MRTISIKYIGLPDKSSVYIEQQRYTVCLGNGSKRSFSSLRNAKAYLAKTNRFLNNKLDEINFLNAAVYDNYKRTWLYLSERDEDSILSSFEYINSMQRRCVNNCSGPNGNYFVFNYMNGAIDDLLKIAKTLFKVNKDRILIVLIEQILRLKKDIELFPGGNVKNDVPAVIKNRSEKIIKKPLKMPTPRAKKKPLSVPALRGKK